MKLSKIIQRLKSLVLTSLSPTQRQEIKDTLLALHHQYQSGQLDFDTYKIQALSLLLRHRDSSWVEQFLYRETGNFLTQAEKFTLTSLSQK